VTAATVCATASSRPKRGEVGARCLAAGADENVTTCWACLARLQLATIDLGHRGMPRQAGARPQVTQCGRGFTGRLDRSPCGTGTSARLGVLKARGVIDVDETFVHESVIGSIFGSHVDRLATVGPHDAVIPRISGQAYITRSDWTLLTSSRLVAGYRISGRLIAERNRVYRPNALPRC
jgi:hypothetical protein